MVGLGVADGVYMWKTQGIDAGLYSRTLMTAARSAVEGGNGDALAGAQCGLCSSRVCEAASCLPNLPRSSSCNLLGHAHVWFYLWSCKF